MAETSGTESAPVVPSSEDDNFSSTAALVAFLRMEAEMAEQKAKRFREQATALARQFGITETLQDAYELNPDQMAPLDEHGVPKYKGKKRGRKPKARKRKSNPNRRKRQHTAYTLFVQETYPGVKAAYPDYPSKDVISIVAKQWKHDITAQEKAQWKARAKETHNEDDDDENQQQSSMEAHEDEAAAAAAAAAAEDDDNEGGFGEGGDDDGEEEVDGGDETEDEDAPPARRNSKRQKKK